MKISRIFPYKRTVDEQRHYDAVHAAKKAGLTPQNTELKFLNPILITIV